MVAATAKWSALKSCGVIIAQMVDIPPSGTVTVVAISREGVAVASVRVCDVMSNVAVSVRLPYIGINWTLEIC